jgi:hypothetical protein
VDGLRLGARERVEQRGVARERLAAGLGGGGLVAVEGGGARGPGVEARA